MEIFPETINIRSNSLNKRRDNVTSTFLYLSSEYFIYENLSLQRITCQQVSFTYPSGIRVKFVYTIDW